MGDFSTNKHREFLPFAAQFTVLAIFLHISADFIYFSMLRHRIGALRHLVTISILPGNGAVIVLGVRQFDESVK